MTQVVIGGGRLLISLIRMQPLIVSEDRIPPVRGLVSFQNIRGRPFRLDSLKRWLQVERVAYGVQKVDVLIRGAVPPTFGTLLEYARTLDFRLSIRTDCSGPRPNLDLLRQQGLLDVFLCPLNRKGPEVETWFEACKASGLPVRLQLLAPFLEFVDVDREVERMAEAGVAVVNLVLEDPFSRGSRCADAAQSRTVVQRMNELAAKCCQRGIEANLIGLPFCLAEGPNRACLANSRQFLLDHQHYQYGAYELAKQLYPRSPVVVEKALVALLARHTITRHRSVDNALLPWLLSKPWLHARVWAWHKLTRHFPLLHRLPRPVENSPEAYEQLVEKVRTRKQRELGEKCSRCRLQRICDGETSLFKRVLPGLSVKPELGEPVVGWQHFARDQAKYYDPIDLDRREFPQISQELARKAKDITANFPPDREIPAEEYEIEGQWTHHMPGANRWYAFTPGEKCSTPLASLSTPFTLAVTFGGGIADYIGFAFGRRGRVLCSMEGFRHRVTLHAAPDGRYVLLRDGQPVRPAEFEGTYYAPPRLASRLSPRIAIWNIDGAIVTQSVLIWEGANGREGDLSRISYSVLIVSSRFSRRLQAVLRTIAHQQDFDLRRLEIIVCYVPDIDATEDLLESFSLAFPHVRVVRSPFPEGFGRAKGFQINESVHLASGEWVILLDSDILLPPNWFRKMDELADTCAFIVPDGRKMLSPIVTGQVLLGEIEPWRCWDELLSSPGEFRLKEAMGVPVGYCQCVKKSCLDSVQYQEFEHFEGADWWFAVQMRERFGPENRLSGLPVLHLDHGGSQWYGTHEQR